MKRNISKKVKETINKGNELIEELKQAESLLLMLPTIKYNPAFELPIAMEFKDNEEIKELYREIAIKSTELNLKIVRLCEEKIKEGEE